MELERAILPPGFSISPASEKYATERSGSAASTALFTLPHGSFGSTTLTVSQWHEVGAWGRAGHVDKLPDSAGLRHAIGNEADPHELWLARHRRKMGRLEHQPASLIALFVALGSRFRSADRTANVDGSTHGGWTLQVCNRRSATAALEAFCKQCCGHFSALHLRQ